jgi:ureidoglycolate lyase
MSGVVIISGVPSPADFAPFGALIDRPERHGDRRFYSDWLGGEGLEPIFHINSMAETALPARLDTLERHPHAAQCFVPLDVERYLVTVAPSRADGSPDLAALRTFLVPGTKGVIYERGVWHAGASVLDRPGSFAVLMWRGRADDDEMVAIAPITMIAEELVQ